MTVTLTLPPDIEASLVAQAQAEGLSLDQFLSRKLETLAARGGRARTTESADAEAWERKLDEWLDSFSATSSLSEDALKRENWYADRW